MSNEKNRNAINVIASILGYAVPLLVNLIATPFLLHSLGNDAFGIQVLVNVVIGYLAIMDMGIGLPLIKYLAEDRAKGDMKSASDLLSTTLVLYLVLGIFGMFVAFGISGYLAEHLFSIPNHLINKAKLVFQLAAVGFFATLLMGWGRSVAMGLQRYEVAYAISALSSVLGVGIGLYLVYAGFGVVGYVFSKVLFLFIASFVYFVIYRIFIPEYKITLHFDKASIIRIRSYLVYGIIHRGVSGLAGSIDKTLLGILVSTASVGLYSLPYMLANAVNYALSFMLSFIFPASSELYATGQYDRLRELFINSSRFLAAVSCMVFVPLFLLGKTFLFLWLGHETGEKVLTTFYLLTLAAFFQVLLTSLTNCVMVGIGRVDRFTMYTIIRVVVLSVLCILLIPMFNYEGAAWAVLITCVVDVAYFILFLKKYLEVGVASLLITAYMRPLFLGGGLGVMLLPFHYLISSWFDILVLAVVIEVTLISLYYHFNVLRESEKELIRSTLARLLILRSIG